MPSLAPSPPGERVEVRGKSTSKLPSDSDSPAKPQFSLLPRVKPSRRLTGKVARLPHLVRTLVNTMLDDGFTYNAIVSKLEQLGYPGFLQQNISRWTKGGYQVWLREQEQCRRWLPLPEGEGRGEGEGSIKSERRVPPQPTQPFDDSTKPTPVAVSRG